MHTYIINKRRFERNSSLKDYHRFNESIPLDFLMLLHWMAFERKLCLAQEHISLAAHNIPPPTLTNHCSMVVDALCRQSSTSPVILLLQIISQMSDIKLIVCSITMNPFLPNVLPPQSKEVELKLYLIFGKFYLSTTAIAFDLKEWLRNKTYWIRKFLF